MMNEFLGALNLLERITVGAWEVDHIRPRSRGGTDYLRNLVPACIECNRSKGDLNSREFEEY
jgi:5-methylcytosine-specific restriction endonuclease McrA